MKYLKTNDCDGDPMFIDVRDETYEKIKDRLSVLVSGKSNWSFVEEHDVTDEVFNDDEIEIHLSSAGL